MAHVLVDGFGHLHEFVFTELAVFIFVEFFEHLGWVGRVRSATAFFATSARGAMLAGLTTAASGAHFAHFFFCFRAFGFV